MKTTVLCKFCGVIQLAEKLPHVSPTQETTRLPSACRVFGRGGRNLTPGLFTASNYGCETSNVELSSEKS